MTRCATRAIAIFATLGISLPLFAQDPPPAAEPEAVTGEVDPQVLAAGQAALAERFAEMAQLALRAGQLEQPEFRQSAALLRAAATLNPGDPRYWRLLTEAELQLGNSDGALTALQGFRKAAPDDRVGQIQLVELYAARTESGDEALKYLRGLLVKESLPAEVRSHVAVQIARRMLDRGEEGQVTPVLEQAISLNSVNVAALNLKYELVLRDGPAPARVAGLLAMLRANPIRPAAMAELGRLLAGAGVGKESLDWLNRALALYGMTGSADRATYHDLLIDYAAQVYLAGQLQAAREIVERLTKSDPADVDAWLLRLVIERSAEDQTGGAYAKTLEAAETQLWQRWGAVARQVLDENAPPADGEPADVGGEAGADVAAAPGEGQPPADAAGGGDAPLAAAPDANAEPLDFPEPAAIVEHLKANPDDHKQALFVSAAADFAWFDVYFKNDAEAAGKWIDALAAALPADSVTLVRLRGWQQIAGKQDDEARQTLAPVREGDPLSALGLLRLEFAAAGTREAERAVDDDARKLLASHPSGLVGAIFAQDLRARALKPEPGPDAAAIRQELQKFPRAWLDIIDAPQRFYALRVEPLRVAHRFGEPMFVRVLIQNLTEFDISIGEDGVIRPALWFDAHAQAMKGQAVPGTAFERLGQATVLPARQAVAQYVRFDQGQLAALLTRNPAPQLQITGWCTTNPVQAGNGTFGPGPAGVKVPFTKKLSRTGLPINRAGTLESVARGAETGLPETRIRNLDLIGVLVPLVRGAGGAGPTTEPAETGAEPTAQPGDAEPAGRAARVASELVKTLVECTADPMPTVAQWAKFELAHVGDLAQQQEAIDALVADTRWEGRLLGLVASPKLGPAKAEDLATKLAEKEDEEPLVREYAAALVEILQRPPTTQPATDAGAEPDADPADGAGNPDETEPGAAAGAESDASR